MGLADPTEGSALAPLTPVSPVGANWLMYRQQLWLQAESHEHELVQMGGWWETGKLGNCAEDGNGELVEQVGDTVRYALLGEHGGAGVGLGLES